jgi:sirohydrochlorin cobaltochelatase
MSKGEGTMKRKGSGMMKRAIALGLVVGVMLILGACTDSKTTETTASPDGGSVAVGDPEKKVILVVSFGTSYNDTRALTIDATEAAIAAAYPDYEVRRAFTSQIIIDKLKDRDGLDIKNVDQAMQQLVADGVGTLVVQPTHVMSGFEYDEMKASIEPYAANFASLVYGAPLLSSVDDYLALVEAFKTEIAPDVAADTALVLMGHGTHHFANATYAALDYVFKDQGMANVFVGTVESYPDLDTVMAHVQAGGYSKVILQPLMVVAGDHANNDMAGDEEDSWKTVFKSEGFEVETVLRGLGEYEAIQAMYVAHVGDAINPPAEEE